MWQKAAECGKILRLSGILKFEYIKLVYRIHVYIKFILICGTAGTALGRFQVHVYIKFHICMYQIYVHVKSGFVWSSQCRTGAVSTVDLRWLCLYACVRIYMCVYLCKYIYIHSINLYFAYIHVCIHMYIYME